MSQDTRSVDIRTHAGDEPVDVLIIGAGPGGLSASIWCAKLGLTSILVDQGERPGGQLLWIYGTIDDYPGIRAITGSALAELLVDQVTGHDIRIRPRKNVIAVKVDPITVRFEDGESIAARSTVIATGLRRRRLEVPGESEFEGRGMLVSGVLEKEKVAGANIAVIGGGDSAAENALILAETANKVLLIHRRDQFTARDEFMNRISQLPNVEIVTDTMVTEIVGERSVEGIRMTDTRTGVPSEIGVEYVLIRIGYLPNTEFLKGVVDLDPFGYVKTTADCRTSVPGIYAIGDVAHQNAPTIAGAVGGGATAVKQIYASFAQIRQRIEQLDKDSVNVKGE